MSKPISSRPVAIGKPEIDANGMTAVMARPARFTTSGFPAIVAAVVAGIFAVGMILTAVSNNTLHLSHVFYAIAAFIVAAAIASGIYVLSPNESAVFKFFGDYAGTDNQPGLRFTNPFYSVSKVSRRISSLESEKLKVNDLIGNPIEIAAILMWRVVDPAKAILEVKNHDSYVAAQSEAGLREIAKKHPYDFAELLFDEDEDSKDETKADEAKKRKEKISSIVSLREGGDEIMDELKEELNRRFAPAGVVVVDVRISHLAYSPEIANVMLRRQQATAVIAAKKQIATGCVGIVKSMIKSFEADSDFTLDNEKKATIAANLLVVMMSDRDATPVLNTGTLYG